MKYLDKLSSEISQERLQMVMDTIEHLDATDIEKINRLRMADKKNKLTSEYDFTSLDTKKILSLSMYNV